MIPTILALSMGLPAADGTSPRIIPAVNEVRQGVPPGEPPYEMVWAGRTEEREPLVPFEDLAGWTIELHGGAEASFERSHEQRVWGSYSGKLTYRGQGRDDDGVVVRPPQPIPIPGPFTAANLWCYGNNWGFVPDPGTPQVELILLLVDADGTLYRIYTGRVRWEEWWLVHNRVINSLGQEPKFPFSFAGIEITGGNQPEDRVLFFDSLSFYEETWPELTFEPRPERNIDLYPGQDPGLNTGPGRLPFPTRPETILPTNFAEGYRTHAHQAGNGAYEFSYEGPDCTIAYTVRPAAQGLGEIAVRIDGRPAGRALSEGGVQLAGDASTAPELHRVRLANGILHVRQKHEIDGEAVRVEYAYRIMGKSLVIDAICRGGKATDLDLGFFEDVDEPETIPLPYSNYGGVSHCLMARNGGRPFFASAWIDWYRSNASELVTGREVTGRRARVNGGSRYRPKTDGQRNDLFDRLFLTVSPLFEETLPTIANPPSRWGHVARERLWQESWGPADFAVEHQRSRRLRAYGIEKLIQCNHEISWRDNADSFTLRIKAAPKKGGDEALREYVARQKGLGWLSGLYTNYTDFAPVNENWNEHAVQLESNREWRAAWPRCYALKPSRAVEFDAKYAPMIQKKYGSNSAYTDVHTAIAPWYYCDYDARVPGAGTFAATFYAYGELLLNDSRVYGGPIFSEGGYHCLYAGLPDGNYALQYGGYNLSRDPILPQFDLFKIHPLSTDFGMGWTGNYCTWDGWSKPENISNSIDRFLMATLAYGHIGWLVEEPHGIDLACRSYYMIQQAAKRYAMVPSRRVDYLDGDRIVSTSEALASGAYKHSQLRVEYENGLELWVNGSWDRWWKLPANAGGHVLPPAGWFVRARDGGFWELSGLHAGRRIDVVESPEYLYIDGRGAFTELDHLAARGAVALRAPLQTRLEIIGIAGNDEIGFGCTEDVSHLPHDHVVRRLAGLAASRPTQAAAFDVDGNALGSAEIRWANGKCWLMPVEKAIRYEVKPGPGSPKGAILEASCPQTEVAPGQQVTLDLRSTPPAELDDLSVSARGSALEASVDSIEPGRSRVTFTVPADAEPGRALWVRVASSGASRAAWAVLNVRRLAELSVSPATVLLRGGEGTLTITGRVGLAGQPADLSIETPQGFTVEPQRIEGGPEIPTQVTVRGAGAVSGELRLVARGGALREVHTFELQPGETRPDELDFANGTVPFSWGQCLRGKEERRGDAQTGSACYASTGLSSGGVERRGLYTHPPYNGGVGYTYIDFEPTVVPDEPCELRLFIGIMDGGDLSDGIDFIIEAGLDDGTRVALMKENTSARAWREVVADLEPIRGKRVSFRFIADVGPHDSSTSDWGCWGEPVVRLKRPIPTVTLVAK